MDDKLKIQKYENNILNDKKKQNIEKKVINIDNNKDKDNDNDNSQLKENEITEIEEKYNFGEVKITCKDKISLFIHILNGIIVLFHSFHFIFSEYVRNINYS